MNSLYNELMMILGFELTVRLPEIIICELGALILGFTIHFFWNSKKDLDLNKPEQNPGISENDNWKLKYYNDMDMQERAQQQLRERLTQVQDTEKTLSMELEENRAETDELRDELEVVHNRLSDAEAKLKPPAADSDQPDLTNNYIAQLRLAQEKLAEHNINITRLLEQTRLVEESEKKRPRTSSTRTKCSTNRFATRASSCSRKRPRSATCATSKSWPKRWAPAWIRSMRNIVPSRISC